MGIPPVPSSILKPELALPSAGSVTTPRLNGGARRRNEAARIFDELGLDRSFWDIPGQLSLCLRSLRFLAS